MNYSTKNIYNYEVYIDDEKNMVHHAVNWNSSNPVTLYPYKLCREGGWDNAVGEYTVQQFRRKLREGTGIFR